MSDPTPSTPSDALQKEVAEAAAIASRHFARYVILGEIGRGGMGTVYRAWDPPMQRVVALKVVTQRPGTGPEEIERFHIEAKATARLNHPGIVGIFDHGEVSGSHYIAMPFVEGDTVRTWLERELPLAEMVRIIRDVARALHHAHEQGIVHRDVKPSNIIIDAEGQPRLTDFGLSRDMTGDTKLTVMGEALGTPMYMSPEQAQGIPGNVGPATDIWSLGGVLFWAACRRPPFSAAGNVELFIKIMSDPPPRPRVHNPEVPEDLETVILRCLRKDPADRYASASDLADDLDAILEKRPIKRVGGSSARVRRSRGDSSSRHRARGDSSARHRARGDSQRVRAGAHGPASRRSKQMRAQDPRGGVAIGAAVTAAVAAVAIGAALYFTGALGARGGAAPDEASAPKTPAGSVTLEAPAEGAFTREAEVIVRGAVGPADASLVWVAGRSAPVADGRFEVTIPLPEEGRTEIAVAAAPGGEPLARVSVHRDRTRPAIEDMEPATGAVVGASGALSVRGRVIEDNLRALTVDGAPVTPREDGTFRALVNASEPGEKTIEVRATDAAGNEATARIVLRVDAARPTVVIEKPAPNAFVPGPQAVLEGRVRDADPKQVLIDGAPHPVEPDGSFAVTVTLGGDGPQRFAVGARDATGLEAEVIEHRFVRDSNAPRVTIEEPANGLVTGAETISVRGRVEDEGPPATVSVNGVERPLSDGRFVGEVRLEPGENEVAVVCADRAGNRVKRAVRVERDATPPGLALEPIPAFRFGPRNSDARVTVRGSVDEDGCRVRVNGAAARLDGRRFEAHVTLDEPGVGLIEVEAADRHGNTVHARRSVEWWLKTPGMWWTPAKAQLAWARKNDRRLWIEGFAGMRFVLVPPVRSFRMGSPRSQIGRGPDEDERQASVEEAFYLGMTEVTNAQLGLMLPGSRQRRDADAPAVGIQLERAKEFCRWLSARDPELDYRLPTEVEWEWACQLAEAQRLVWSDGWAQAARHANLLDQTARAQARRNRLPEEYARSEDGHVGAATTAGFYPDLIGTFHLLGNVWEWTTNGAEGVRRGGSFDSDARDARSARRIPATTAAEQAADLGFRLVATPKRR